MKLKFSFSPLVKLQESRLFGSIRGSLRDDLARRMTTAHLTVAGEPRPTDPRFLQPRSPRSTIFRCDFERLGEHFQNFGSSNGDVESSNEDPLFREE